MKVLRTNSAQSSVVDTEDSRHNHKERTNWFLLHCVSRPGTSIFREKELSQDRPSAGRELSSFRCDWSWIRRNFKRTTRSRLFHKKNQIETCTNRNLFCCGKVPVWPRAMTLGRSVLCAKFHITCGRRMGRSSASSVVRPTARVLQSCRECAQRAEKSQIGTRMFLLGPPWCSKCSQSRFFTRGETLVLPNTTGNYTAKLGDDLLVLQAENGEGSFHILNPYHAMRNRWNTCRFAVLQRVRRNLAVMQKMFGRGGGSSVHRTMVKAQ